MSETKLRVAIYCRVAHEDQLSLDAQEVSMRRFAKAQGYPDSVSYLDNGGSGLSFDRPAFSRLNADIRDGKIGAVIVRNLSRIGRNYLDVESWIKEVEKRSVAFITADHPRDPEFVPDIRQALAAYMRSQRGARSSKKRKSKA